MTRRYVSGAGSVAAIAGHPLHPMLVPFPIAFFVGAFLSDLAYLAWRDPFWAEASVVLLGAGLVAGALAGLVGLVDLLCIGRARTLSIGWAHAVGNIALLAITFLDLLIRREDPEGSIPYLGITLSSTVTVLLLVTVWLGGALSYRHGIGVAPEVGAPADGDDAAEGQAPRGSSDRPDG